MEDPVTLHAIQEGAIVRVSTNTAHITEYGHHLLKLGSQHHLIIYNGMAQWPTSREWTCIPHGVIDGGGVL